MLHESELRNALNSDENIISKSKEICEELLKKKYDISKFVESIGFALTSTDVEMRVNGTKLLSTILTDLPNDYLTEFQLNFIVTFYCDRLKDHHNVIPSIIFGISALIGMKNLPDDAVTKILRIFFEQTTCQSQTRTDRFKFFEILKEISKTKSKELKAMGADFIYGVINSLDGERDPRNLQLILTFMPEFIENYNLFHLSEEMFEVFSCYFPIDFNPSKNDPTCISRDNLADLLANCLVASESFVEWSVTLAIEKLESDLVIAKIDSLELLNRCAQKFPIAALEEHLNNIWFSLKTELFSGSDSAKIHETALKTLKTILDKISLNKEVSKNYQTTILGTILTHLSDASHRLFAPSRLIAIVCVSSDPLFASDKILSTLVLKLKSKDCTNEEKRLILSTISEILIICTVKNVFKELPKHIKEELEIELMTIVQDKSKTDEITESLLNCLVTIMNSFDQKNRNDVYELLETTLKTKQIKLENIMKRLAHNSPGELKEKLIDPLISNFHAFPINIMEKLYKNLICLVEFEEFLCTIISLILKNIFESKSNEILKLTLTTSKALLEEQPDESEIINKLYHENQIIDKIFKYVQSEKLSFEILEDFATILNVLIRKLSKDEQKNIILKYLPEMKLNLATDLFLTKGILGFMHESINIDDHFENLLNDFTNLSLNSENETLRKIYLHLICSLLNKTDTTDMNKTGVSKILQKLKDEIKKGNKKAVEALSWIAKGLIVRGHPDAGEIIETLSELLDHPTLSKSAILAFEIISQEYPQLHLPIVKYLFKQKYFHIVLKHIEKYLLNFSENHLNAFIYVLQMTPHQVLKLNIDKIGTILFKCLVIEKPSTILIALNIVKKFLREKDEYFRTNLNHLIPQFLKLTELKYSIKIRISALECLEAITQYPTFVLLPLKTDVILALTSPLDDHKRIVRNAAVKTRNLWYMIGSPGET